MLEVQNKDNKLVVDSRLIAEELGIQHKNLLETIKKYESNIECDFEPLLFETRVVKLPQGGSYQEKYYLLIEEQATFLMTLSKNTEQVVQAKLNLIKAFSKAKQLLLTLEPKLPVELIDIFKDMKEEMKVLTARTKRLDELEEASTKHKGCGNVIKAEVDEEDADLVTVFEYLRLKGFGYEQANKLARRAASFSRVGMGDNYEPPKNKKGHLMFEVKYLNQAFLSICNL